MNNSHRHSESADRLNALHQKLTRRSAGQQVPGPHSIRILSKVRHYSGRSLTRVCSQYSPAISTKAAPLLQGPHTIRISMSYPEPEKTLSTPSRPIESSILPTTPQSPVTLFDPNAVCIRHMHFACYMYRPPQHILTV